jgi:hypothetical protein
MTCIQLPSQKTLYIRKNAYRTLKQGLRGRTRFLPSWLRKNYQDYTSVWAFQSKIQAFKSTLKKEELGLSEEEVKKKYPNYEQCVSTLSTEKWVAVSHNGIAELLVEGIIGSCVRLQICSRCEGRKHPLEFSSTNHPDLCRACRQFVLEDESKIVSSLHRYFKKEEVEHDAVLLGKGAVWKAKIPKPFAEKLEEEGFVQKLSGTQFSLLVDHRDLKESGKTVKQTFGPIYAQMYQCGC